MGATDMPPALTDTVLASVRWRAIGFEAVELSCGFEV
jgi:hypothetical protein